MAQGSAAAGEKKGQSALSARVKLLELNEFLLPDQAAEYLALLTGTAVNMEQLWTLVLNGRLTLLLDFVRVQYARKGRILKGEDAASHTHSDPSYTGDEFELPADLNRDPRWTDRYFVGQGQTIEQFGPDTGVRKLRDGEVLVLDSPAQPCGGLWELLPVADGRHFINNLLQQALGAPRIEMLTARGTFICKPGEQDIAWELQEATTLPNDYCSSVGVPEDCRPVFLTTALKRFVAEELGTGPIEPHAGDFKLATALRILGAVLQLKVGDAPRKALVMEINELQMHGCRDTNVEKYFAEAMRQLDLGLKGRTLATDPK